jgi:AP-4 complex subunit epsilon-1
MSPSSVTDAEFDERARRGLMDKEPSVIGAALNLYHEELKRGQVMRYKGLVSNFVTILK